MSRIVMDDTDCADCLCRVCALNEDNDSQNHRVRNAECHCDCEIGKTRLIETTDDCPKFMPDEELGYEEDLTQTREVVVRVKLPFGVYDCNGCSLLPACLGPIDTRNRTENCRILSVLPEKHGRLVDADKLSLTKIGRTWCDPCPVWGEIYRAETIVPATERSEA